MNVRELNGDDLAVMNAEAIGRCVWHDQEGPWREWHERQILTAVDEDRESVLRMMIAAGRCPRCDGRGEVDSGGIYYDTAQMQHYPSSATTPCPVCQGEPDLVVGDE